MRGLEDGRRGTRSAADSRSAFGQKRAQRREQRVRLFDVRHVPRVLDDNQLRLEGARRGLGRRERDGILPAMRDERRQTNRVELSGREKIVVAQALPH